MSKNGQAVAGLPPESSPGTRGHFMLQLPVPAPQIKQRFQWECGLKPAARLPEMGTCLLLLFLPWGP